MFNIDDPHQFFQMDDDNGVMQCRWTMDKIERADGEVWLMNHMFINPDANKDQILAQEMNTLLFIAQESKILVWPTDPMVIDYFNKHAEFSKIWYHKPASE